MIDATQWTCSTNAAAYQAACLAAAETDDGFAAFRRDPYICGVIEARPVEWLALFLSAVQQSGAVDMAAALSAAETNDRYGSPVTGDWLGHQISSTTAAYLLQYAMARTLFGDLGGFRVAEIGGGYGGLASLFVQLCRPVEFAIYDLQSPMLLASRFLGLTCPGYRFDFRVTNAPAQCDLLISCCALSELNDEGHAYYADILRNSARGLITWSVTEQSEPWATEYGSAVAHLQAIMPDRRVVAATESAAFRQHFAWWAPNTFIWGHSR